MLRPYCGEVVERVGGGGQLVLAAVAGAGVDVAQRERAARGRRAARRSSRRTRRRWLSRTNIGSAVGAGVAELEALVDQRELGQQVAGGGVRERRPVGVGAGAQVHRAQPAAVAFDQRRRWRREGSRRGRRRSRCASDVGAGCGPGASGPASSWSSSAKDCSSSSARWTMRLATSPAAPGAVTGSNRPVPQARAFACAGRGDAGGAGRGADGAEPLGVVAGEDADAAEAVLQRRGELELAPGASRARRASSRSSRRARSTVAASSVRSLAPTRTVSNRKRWPVRRSLRRCARSLSVA